MQSLAEIIYFKNTPAPPPSPEDWMVAPLMRFVKAGVIRHYTGPDSGHSNNVGFGLVEMAYDVS